MSPYHLIKNRILIAGDSGQLGLSRRKAISPQKHAWNMSMREVIEIKDNDSVTVLQGLRAELDPLDDVQNRRRT